MLRQRHDSLLGNRGKWGDFHLTYLPDSIPRIRASARAVEGGDIRPSGKGPPAGPAAALLSCPGAARAGEPGGTWSRSPLTRAAGRTDPAPDLRAIWSTACSASRQPTGRSPNAS